MHGFLGPNGSGKTTTIRMLLGLARADQGHDGALRAAGPAARCPAVIDRVGAVVESPEVLAQLQRPPEPQPARRARIGAPTSRVDAALETVSLTGRDRDRYKSYSLGMKQRLAIAATLLKDPDLLILDEPTNGLDPAGIREIRDTIRDLGDAGVTVLLSSHILAEVQQVCTSATIIGNGRLLASGKVDDLLGAGTAYRVVVPDPAAARRVLEAAGLTVTHGPADGIARRRDRRAGPDHRAARRARIWLTELTPVRADLETFFLELTAADTLGGRRRDDDRLLGSS